MLVIALALAAPLPPLPNQWAEFGREGALSRVRETVEIATIPATGPDAMQYRLRYTKSSPGYLKNAPKGSSVEWTDSLSCPAARAVVIAMRDLAPPTIAPFGIPGRPNRIVLDGTGYWLNAPSSDPAGQITLRSNVGSTLARWVDASFKQLASCWAAVSP